MPMLKLKSSSAAANALVGLWTITLTAFVIATLYVARDLLMPLTLAAPLTFLLATLVTRLERWLGRTASVLLVVALILAATGAAGCAHPRSVRRSKRRCGISAFDGVPAVSSLGALRGGNT